MIDISSPKTPIPTHLRQKFREVVGLILPEWHGGQQEPEVIWNREHHSMSAICDFVNNPNYTAERMPDFLIDAICELADATHPPLTDRTYQGGARYVFKIIERRRREFESRHGRL